MSWTNPAQATTPTLGPNLLVRVLQESFGILLEVLAAIVRSENVNAFLIHMVASRISATGRSPRVCHRRASPGKLNLVAGWIGQKFLSALRTAEPVAVSAMLYRMLFLSLNLFSFREQYRVQPLDC